MTFCRERARLVTRGRSRYPKSFRRRYFVPRRRGLLVAIAATPSERVDEHGSPQYRRDYPNSILLPGLPSARASSDACLFPNACAVRRVFCAKTVGVMVMLPCYELYSRSLLERKKFRFREKETSRFILLQKERRSKTSADYCIFHNFQIVNRYKSPRDSENAKRSYLPVLLVTLIRCA